MRFFSILLAALAIFTASGCATFDTGIRQDDTYVQQDEVKQQSALTAPVTCATSRCDTALDVEPSSAGLYPSMEGFMREVDRLPWGEARAPPDQLALLTLPLGIGGTQGTAVPIPDGYWPLQTTLVPSWSAGSGTPTFTRASTAYQQDFEAKYNLALSGEARFQGSRRVENLISSDLSTWSLLNGTLGTGITDPHNGVNAFTFTTTTGGEGAYVLISAPNTGLASRISWYAKRRTGTGGVKINGSAGDQQDYTAVLTTSWQRFALDVSTASGANIRFWLVTAGDAIDLYLPMMEYVYGQANQNPSEPVSKGLLSAPYHGANVDGVKYFDTLNGNTVASNVVTEATGAPIVTGASGVSASAPVDAGGPFGYLAENARSDVLGTTAAIRRTMTDAGWAVGATMTVGAATGTDGVASAAASLTGGAVTATNTILFTTVLGSAERTYGAWIRRKTGTGTIEMTDNNGTNWTDITSTLTTTYKLFQVTRTQANPIVGFRITTNADAIEVDFNTIEAATSANSTPIPLNVSKAADVLSFPSAGNIASAQGSSYAEVAGIVNSAQRDILMTGSGTGYAMYENNNLFLYDGASRTLATFATSAAVQKIATSWGGTAANGFVSGVLGATSPATFDGDMNFAATLYIGGDGVNQRNGTLRNVRIWLSNISNAQLTTQTSDAYEWLMPYRVAWLEPQQAANDGVYLMTGTR